MLILNRRRGEEIVIADDIRVTIVAIKGNQVRIGITAPSSVSVIRQELLVDTAEDAAPLPAGSSIPGDASLRIDS